MLREVVKERATYLLPDCFSVCCDLATRLMVSLCTTNSQHDLSPLTSQVYLCLIKMYLSPPNLAEYGIRLPDGSQPEANVNDALRVLTAHHDLIDTAKVRMCGVGCGWVGVG